MRREFRKGRRIEKGFGVRTSRREKRKCDKELKESTENRMRRAMGGLGGGGVSSVTARVTEHCSAARLLAIVPIQSLINLIISLLLKSRLRMMLFLNQSVCVCVSFNHTCVSV